MDKVDALIILFRVDNLRFEADIKPDGRYVIYGPIWPGAEKPIMAKGKLGFGFALPGLQRSLTEMVKLSLKL